jgi:transcriptional regulator with XRE-family HTH domain
MTDISAAARLLQHARILANLTQRDMAERVGTSQSAIAMLERGATNPTIDTLARCAAATGFALSVELVPLPVPDAVVERYKQDVDRSLLRENLKKSANQRLRTLSEWQRDGAELQRATRKARRRV